MDKDFKIIRELYRDTGQETDPDFLQAADGQIRREYRELSAVKKALDRRNRPRPDPAAIDFLVEQASRIEPIRPVLPRTFRPDRLAVAHSGSKVRRQSLYGVMGFVFTLFIAVSVGYWNFSPSDTDQASLAAQAEKTIREAPVVQQEAAPPAELADVSPVTKPSVKPDLPVAEAIRKPEPARVNVSDAAAVKEQVRPVRTEEMTWDQAEELRALHRDLELIEARTSSTAWDEPSLFDTVLPSGSENDGKWRGVREASDKSLY